MQISQNSDTTEIRGGAKPVREDSILSEGKTLRAAEKLRAN